MNKKLIIFGAIIFALAACDKGSTSPEIAKFWIESDTVTVKFNPAEFTHYEVVQILRYQCKDEGIGAVGIRQFVDTETLDTTCTQGVKLSGSFGEAEKTSNGILIETTYSDNNGNIQVSSQTL